MIVKIPVEINAYFYMTCEILAKKHTDNKPLARKLRKLKRIFSVEHPQIKINKAEGESILKLIALTEEASNNILQSATIGEQAKKNIETKKVQLQEAKDGILAVLNPNAS